jgi:hypothetical protein
VFCYESFLDDYIRVINCLLFADDIVLIGKTEEELQSLLTIAGIFASKWNMKFNASKSKVMVSDLIKIRNGNWETLC